MLILRNESEKLYVSKFLKLALDVCNAISDHCNATNGMFLIESI